MDGSSGTISMPIIGPKNPIRFQNAVLYSVQGFRKELVEEMTPIDLTRSLSGYGPAGNGGGSSTRCSLEYITAVANGFDREILLDVVPCPKHCLGAFLFDFEAIFSYSAVSRKVAGYALFFLFFENFGDIS